MTERINIQNTVSYSEKIVSLNEHNSKMKVLFLFDAKRRRCSRNVNMWIVLYRLPSHTATRDLCRIDSHSPWLV